MNSTVDPLLDCTSNIDDPIIITRRQLVAALVRRAKRLRKSRTIFLQKDDIAPLAEQSAYQLLDDLKKAGTQLANEGFTRTPAQS